MKKIRLTRGLMALVDDEDYTFLTQWKWCADQKGYAVRSEKRSETGRKSRKLIKMHKEILPCKSFIDHINGIPYDNRRSNLRPATASENMRNRKMAYNCKSGFKGVWFNKKKQRWIAYIKVNNQTKILAHCKDKYEAAHIYNQFAEQLFGEFARLNDV